MKILINTEITADHRQQIQSVSPDLIIVEPRDETGRLAAMPDTEVVFGDFNRSLFHAAEQLRWVQVLGAGVDGLLFPEFVESDVVLTSAKGFVGPHLADQTWALILGLIRGVGRAVRERTWENRWSIRDETWELAGRTLGIVGLGGTGIDVAKRAQGFDMRVIAVDPEDVDVPSFVHEVWKMDRFYDLLADSDIVAICAPLTEETRGMFDGEAFGRMKPGGLLINVTRGKIVDEGSLLRALEDGWIGGAGLDVTPEEPLPQDSPLWGMPNVIVTPHVAGGSPHRDGRTVGLFCDNLERFLVGKPLLSVINKRKGY
ncbi:MAG: D-2-hydroxyacid dehydrogenase [Candidatus Poribacteria bacterium]|nr:D-2-hydroxyacid dehydrogenase [Candidatus Poribacteria bacterium]MDE0503774.1 D-2-hydroxyacid dehydrogenase [Candidatus Poribacteria bacterium]